MKRSGSASQGFYMCTVSPEGSKDTVDAAVATAVAIALVPAVPLDEA